MLRQAPHLLRAEALIDMGEYQRAIAEVQRAYDRIPAGKHQEKWYQIDALTYLSVASTD